MKRYFYTNQDNQEIGATLYHEENRSRSQPLIIYIHGGGLIYGSREDLPQKHIDLLGDLGYQILALDYPLIPENSLQDIISSLSEGIQQGIETYSSTGEYILFGRSAGAYLTLLLSSQYLSDNKPNAIISFYGYYHLEDPLLCGESRYYNKYPKLDDNLINPLISKEKNIFSAPIEQRYPIYLSYRQRGTWIEHFIKDSEQKITLSLSEQDIKSLPKMFITASQDDSDVPFSQSQKLHNLASDSTLITVQHLPHDFDKLVDDPQTTHMLNELSKWLNAIN